MRIPKLDNRLALIYEMIGDAQSVCDVGADHGKLALHLEKAGKRVIATDISVQSLKKTERLIKLHWADIDLRVGDGLTVIKPDEVEAVVMAGMGQGTICDILDASPDVVKSLSFIVAQPMNGEYDLRSYLSENGFDIISERVAKEAGRLYCIIKAAPSGGKHLTECQKHFGPKLMANNFSGENEKAYAKRNIAIMEDILEGIKSAGQTESKRYKSLKSVLDEVKVMI